MCFLPYGGRGGWVGLSESLGGWVSNPPPPSPIGSAIVGDFGLAPKALVKAFCLCLSVYLMFVVQFSFPTTLPIVNYTLCAPHPTSPIVVWVLNVK